MLFIKFLLNIKHIFYIFRDAFVGLSHLDKLNISKNHLKYIHPDFCQNLPSVTLLDLSENELKDLFNSTLNKNNLVGRLTSMFLYPKHYKNKLFAKCSSLKKLYLNDDEIPTFYSDFVQSKSLTKLSLVHNDINFASVEYNLFIYLFFSLNLT